MLGTAVFVCFIRHFCLQNKCHVYLRKIAFWFHCADKTLVKDSGQNCKSDPFHPVMRTLCPQKCEREKNTAKKRNYCSTAKRKPKNGMIHPESKLFPKKRLFTSLLFKNARSGVGAEHLTRHLLSFPLPACHHPCHQSKSQVKMIHPLAWGNTTPHWCITLQGNVTTPPLTWHPLWCVTLSDLSPPLMCHPLWLVTPSDLSPSLMCHPLWLVTPSDVSPPLTCHPLTGVSSQHWCVTNLTCQPPPHLGSARRRQQQSTLTFVAKCLVWPFLKNTAHITLLPSLWQYIYCMPIPKHMLRIYMPR